MIRSILIVFVSSLTLNVFAQERYSVGFFHSRPVGKFKEQRTNDGGYALSGYGVMIEDRTRGQNWPEWLFVHFHLNYQVNTVDNENLQVDINKVFSEAFGNLLRAEVYTGSFRPVSITGGPDIVKKFGKLEMDLKTGIGIMFTNIDPIIIDIFDDQSAQLESDRILYNGRPNFTFRAGLGITYQLSDYVGVGGFIHYGFANEKVTGSLDTADLDSSNQVISFINSGISISVRFL